MISEAVKVRWRRKTPACMLKASLEITATVIFFVSIIFTLCSLSQKDIFMEQFGPQKDWQSFCRGMVTNGVHPEKDIVMGRAP